MDSLLHSPPDKRHYKTIETISRIQAVLLQILVRTTTRNLCKEFDRCTIMDIVRTVTSHISVTTEDTRVELRRCKSRIYGTVLDMCRFTVDVAVRPSCLYNSLEEKLNHDYCQTCFYKSRLAVAEAANVQDCWSALQGLRAAEG